MVPLSETLLNGPVTEFDPERFVYVKIQDAVGPLDRGDKYEDGLQEALREQQLGEITGGGSQLGEDNPDGTPTIASSVNVPAPDRLITKSARFSNPAMLA